MASQADLQLMIEAKDLASDVLNKTKKNITGFADDTAKSATGLQGALGGMLSVAGGMGVFSIASQGVGMLGDQLGDMISGAMEAEAIQAQLNNVIKSTGGAAGMTADAVNDLASQLQNVTTFEDDSIVSGENLLLTFTNIGKDVFPEATRTMLDMSQALGQDMKSSATQLGKALNDPIAGVSALSRVGVTFTDEQKEQIKTLQESGDIMGAQKVVLAELSREFGGAAEAAGTTFGGQMAILQNKLGGVKDQIGAALIPIIQGLLQKVMEVAGWIKDNFGPVFEQIWAKMQEVFAKIQALWEEHGAKIMAFLQPLIENVKTIIGTGLQTIMDVLQVVLDLLSGNWEGAWEGIKNIASNVWNAILSIASNVWTAFSGILSGIWEGIKTNISTTLDGLKTLLSNAWDAITGAASAAWNGIASIMTGIWEGVKGAFIGGVNAIIGALNWIIDAINAVEIKIPEIDIFGWKTGGWTIGLPDIPKVPLLQLGTGGIVTGPTVAMIGERGPEAVVPLGRDSGMIDYGRLARAIARELGGQQINMQVDGRTFARVMRPYQDGMVRIAS